MNYIGGVQNTFGNLGYDNIFWLPLYRDVKEVRANEK